MAYDWYPFNPTKFRQDTYHLCAAADGIYRRLIDEYMLTRSPLPDNDAALAGIARVGLSEWNEHREVVRAFFRAKDGKLFQKRCDHELNAQGMRQALRSAIGKEGATIRWAREKQNQQRGYLRHALPNANAMPPHATLQRKKERRAESQAPPCASEKEASDKGVTATPFLARSLKEKGWA